MPALENVNSSFFLCVSPHPPLRPRGSLLQVGLQEMWLRASPEGCRRGAFLGVCSWRSENVEGGGGEKKPSQKDSKITFCILK